LTHWLVGLITIFAIVLVPVYVFIIATFVGKPRAPKVSALILALPAALTLVAILFTWILGGILSLVVP
jgi:hypothetical protein